MKKQLLVIAAIIIIGLSFIMLTREDAGQGSAPSVTREDALDLTLNFYNDWLTAAQSTTTDPYTTILQTHTAVAPVLTETITISQGSGTNGTLDPVLCQPLIPERVGGKVLFQLEDEAQVIIFARGFEEKSPYQAIVSLQGAGDTSWQITDISCSTGEVAPEQAYDFEQAGFLLKSVPPPLDPDRWHLVFEQAGVMGHTVPLFFTPESICILTDGSESTCDPDAFTDATPVTVQADMTEAGATVHRLQF